MSLSLKPRIKKKNKNILSRSVDLINMYGPEPVYEDGVTTYFDFGHALNWLSRAKDYKFLREQLINYLRRNSYDNDFIKTILLLHESYGITEGKIAYLINSGWDLERINETILINFEKGLKDLYEFSLSKKEESKKEVIGISRGNNKNKLIHLGGVLSDAIEEYVFRTFETSETLIDTLLEDQTADSINIALTRLSSIADEMKLCQTDNEYREGYSHLTIPQIKKIEKALKKSCDILKERQKSVTVINLPSSPEKMVKKMKFLKKSDKYGVVSIDPELIIGAKVFIAVDVHLRKISIFYSATDDGLYVSGTTIKNVDTERSFKKSIRDSKKTPLGKFLKELKKINNKQDFIAKIKKMRTLELKVSQRTNDNTLLLKRFK